MRLVAPLLLVAMLSAPAWAQVPPSIGPTFTEKAVNADEFDAVFNVKVTMAPTTELLLGQTPDARFDAVVCNIDATGEGWVKVNPTARTGVLKAGECTMFANFGRMSLTPIDIEHQWTAKVFLRAIR
ncbi:MAG: hypothetical protein Q8R02_16300 [Hyphomonadaceae bacterium]|nr:hypothetical protein [Hyphomonadaceae bacterium]